MDTASKAKKKNMNKKSSDVASNSPAETLVEGFAKIHRELQHNSQTFPRFPYGAAAAAYPGSCPKSNGIHEGAHVQ